LKTKIRIRRKNFSYETFKKCLKDGMSLILTGAPANPMRGTFPSIVFRVNVIAS